jgi:hypothetical protein
MDPDTRQHRHQRDADRHQGGRHEGSQLQPGIQPATAFVHPAGAEALRDERVERVERADAEDHEREE